MAVPPLSKSAKLYQERFEADLQNTRRRPGPRLDFAANAANELKAEPPLPPPYVLDAEANKPPDAGLTRPWPWGGVEEIV